MIGLQTVSNIILAGDSSVQAIMAANSAVQLRISWESSDKKNREALFGSESRNATRYSRTIFVSSAETVSAALNLVATDFMLTSFRFHKSIHVNILKQERKFVN